MTPVRDIDAILVALVAAHPELVHEQLEVTHPTDDDGLWFFRHPGSAYEVQLESTTGQCPFLFETDANDARVMASSVEEAVAMVVRGLGLESPSG